MNPMHLTFPEVVEQLENAVAGTAALQYVHEYGLLNK